ncbi:hypothetical protein ONE63_011040 [Megalurothrips usitatus]|uniref:C2H2-type domain-containing protein n=1 Tax=Megalurothrips usitatus TaxID=439358 RepID=A0AAV7XLF0_9NEOP|nr:hypothetical protein ONE63_011040 [Megalurothrips usitatus]
MRELKQEGPLPSQDPSELELGLEFELASDDVDAAVAAVAAAAEGQIPCSCCDKLLDSTEQLHSHQVEQHSLLELSLALITLRGLDLSLVNGAFEMKETLDNDDSSHLRNILMESVDRPHDCDSESTVTVSSDTRMAMISPPDSPVYYTPEEMADYSPWEGVATSPSYSPNSFMSEVDCYDNQFSGNSIDSGFWSDPKLKTKTKEPPAIDRRVTPKKYNDLDARQFFCDLCDRRYKKKSHLERHQRVHTGVRPYPCPTCDKRFAVRSILNQHIRVHTGERPFACNICSQRFPQKSGLMTHMMLHNGKPFKCEYCVKSFVSNHKLMLHQKCHGDLMLNGAPHQGPYCCSTCDLRFFTTGALTEHAKTHTPLAQSSISAEEAAIAAVTAVAPASPDGRDELLAYRDGPRSPEIQEEFLDIVKAELIDDDDSGLNESFHCEARWSGIDDMCVGPDFSNVY